MAELHEDDLFRHSSMSFGEHLEELRSHLFRAAMWLLIGMVIGFIIGKPVVKLIEEPMENALRDFYRVKTEDDLSRDGRILTASEQDLLNKGFISEQVYVQPEKVLQDLSGLVPGAPRPKTKAELAPTEVPKSDAAPAALAVSGNADDADAVRLLPIMIWHPSKDDPRVQLKSLVASEPFMIYLKAAMLTGVILASPFIFREIWLFVAAGLYPHERRYVHIFLPFSIGLFLAGVLMAFFVAFPPVLKFLLSFNQFLGIAPDPRINDWLSFVLFLPLAFGIGFQLPLVMLFVNRIGLISVQTFWKQWRIAVLAIFVIAMILTPSPDIYSMSLMALPMTVLYFGGIALCAYTSGRRPVGLGSE